MKKYVNFGCGLTAPKEWQNFDASPTLKLQKTPIFGYLFRKMLKPAFPQKNIIFGDIVKGLPNVQKNSIDGVYCSHVLEHLTYFEMILAINNTYKMLKPGGIFRLVMPDLENMVNSYIINKDQHKETASIVFMRNSGMALEKKQQIIKAIMYEVFGNSRHQWLWDKASTKKILHNAGFSQIRECSFNDSEDKMFLLVENKDRFAGALCIEVVK